MILLALRRFGKKSAFLERVVLGLFLRTYIFYDRRKRFALLSAKHKHKLLIIMFLTNIKYARMLQQLSISLLIFMITSSMADQPAAVSMGTTILAARYKDGVVLASDSRTSVSDYVSNRFASKINILFDSSDSSGDAACVCRAGSAADTQHLIEVAKQDINSRKFGYRAVVPSVKSSAYFLRYLLLKNQRSNNDVACSLICAGYDSRSQKGTIYSIAQSGALFDRSEEGIVTLGSGSIFVQCRYL